jgi:hypothetical protein
MVSLNRVDYFILSGNTYGNLEMIRKSGATWDNGSRYWKLQIHRHPLNNAKQKTKLAAMLNALEEGGVRFIAWYTDGKVSQ